MNLPLHRENCLRWLFLDLNSYFASVEQAIHPELIGKPVAVGSSEIDGSTIIAASYEAKAFGIKTGTKVGEAKRLCPDIIFSTSPHGVYKQCHDAIIDAAETVLPVDKVCSIDEMRFRLLGNEREPEQAIQLAHQIKQAIRDHVAPNMSCSVGIAPNPWLAKLATKFQKPDGLILIHPHELPDRLRNLDLTTFTGINRRMKARLNAVGIFTSDDLIDLDPQQLNRVFGSIMGERWYYLLRGYDIDFQVKEGQSLGHSNVLAPEFRNDKDCRAVLLRLTHKACARLRKNQLWASHVNIYVAGRIRSWHDHAGIAPTQDAISLTKTIDRLWATRDFSQPTQVGITFSGLNTGPQTTPSLFESTKDFAKLGHVVDSVNNKFGKNSVYLGSIEKAKDTAGERIAFHKTQLFSEGKGDNEEFDTFRGPKRKPSKLL